MDILPIAWLLFVVNFLFGVLVALGVFPRGRWSRMHHFLYLLTMIGIISATIESIVQQPTLLPATGAMAILLLGMSRFHGGSTGHSLYASLCLLVYSAILYTAIITR